MGFSLKALGKKLGDIAGGVERQVNPLDHGATYSNPHPAPQAPAPVAPVRQASTPVSLGRMPINNPMATQGRIPYQTPGIVTDLVRPVVRAIPNIAVSTADLVQHGKQQYQPTPGAAQALLGKEPITSYQERGKGLDKHFRQSKNPVVRALAPELAVGGQLLNIAGDASVALPVGKAIDAGGRVAVKAGAKVAAEHTIPLDEKGFIAATKSTAGKPKVALKGNSTQVAEPKQGVISKAKQHFAEEDQHIFDTLRAYDRTNGTKEADRFMYNSGIQRRSNSIGAHHFQNSENIKTAISGLGRKDSKEFANYSTARRELSYKTGLKTSRSRTEMKQVVAAGHEKYGPRFDALNAHYKELARYAHEAGITNKKTYNAHIKNNDYIRIQRDFDELVNKKYGSGNSYSLGTTSTKQRVTGSNRDVIDPVATTLQRTQQIHNEISRNRTADHLIEVLQRAGQAKRVPNATTHVNTIKRFKNGKLETYVVSKDMKTAVERINPFELGTGAQIIAAPGRIFRATTTGLNPVFTLTNYVRDQLGSAVLGKNVMRTHNPKNVAQSLYAATRELAGGGQNDAVWQEFIKHAGDQTSFDLTRNARSVRRVVRSTKGGVKNKTLNIVTNPIRSFEDLNSVTEKATRFQNFKGVYNAAIKAGNTKEEASMQATLAAWQHSVDFNRTGDWGRMLNLLVPYWNPATQGVRQLGRAAKTRPIATTAKFGTTLMTPVLAATIWNLSDPERKKVYDNLSDYEKENNIIVIPPGTDVTKSQGGDKSYPVWKLPLPPGVGQLTGVGRRLAESFHDHKPTDFAGMAQDVFSAATGPVNTHSKTQVIGSFVPQVAKPVIQQAMNKDLFTGKNIVPDFMNNATDANGNPIPETKKAYKEMSGTAKAIGKATGTSPIRVEKFIKDTFGTVGLQAENASDNALAVAGKIPKSDIGGQSIKEGFSRRFGKSSGKVDMNQTDGQKYFTQVENVTKHFNGNEKAAYNSLHPQRKNFLGESMGQIDKTYDPAARLDIYNRYPKVFEADKKLNEWDKKQGKPSNPLYDLPLWQVKKVLEKQNLPPGSKDPELSNLYKQDWYHDYQTKQSKFFGDIKTSLSNELATAKKKGDKEQVKKLEGSLSKFGADNPYPTTDSGLQKIMDYYSSLPKGTGARSAWIKANPGQWKRMQDQFAAVDNWQNIARGKRGLDATEGAVGAAAGYSNGSSGSGGFRRGPRGVDSVYTGAINLNAGGKIAAPKVTPHFKSQATVKKKPIAKPKVTIKHSKV